VTWYELSLSSELEHWAGGGSLRDDPAGWLCQYLNVNDDCAASVNLQQRYRSQDPQAAGAYMRMAVVLFHDRTKHCRVASAGWTPFKEVGRDLG